MKEGHARTKGTETRAMEGKGRQPYKDPKGRNDIAFNIPVDLYDECFYVTGILSFLILRLLSLYPFTCHLFLDPLTHTPQGISYNVCVLRDQGTGGR